MHRALSSPFRRAGGGRIPPWFSPNPQAGVPRAARIVSDIEPILPFAGVPPAGAARPIDGMPRHACPYASAMARLSQEANVWRVAEALAATFVRCDQAAVQAWLWISRLRHGGRDAARRGGLGFASEA